MRRSNDASVLIVVLWATVGLASVALLFGHSMVMTYRGADNEVAGRQADQAIEGAIRYARMLLVNEESPGLLPELTAYVGEAVPVGEATYWMLGRSTQVSDGSVREYALVDEASKLNINTATVAMLRALPGMTDEFAAAIVDWRDTDEEPTTNGAESNTYASKQPSYTCKNADFESIEELALMNGATREILYGEDTNLNGVLDPNESDGDNTPPYDNSDSKLDAGILEYVTCFTEEPTQDSEGTERLDVATINSTQGEQQLRDLLSNANIAENRIIEIMTNLTGTPITSVLELYSRGQFTAAEAESVADRVRNTNVKGLVNINTASEEVLACIPGIGTDKAPTLVATRQNRATQDRDMTWAIDAIGVQSIPLAGPFLTGSSYQVMVDVAAVGRHGRGYRREKAILDAKSGTPKVVYRRSLASLGWALGSEAREQLAKNKEVR
jgi:DNA uptake protein ComE-like DNA-binding protein